MATHSTELLWGKGLADGATGEAPTGKKKRENVVVFKGLFRGDFAANRGAELPLRPGLDRRHGLHQPDRVGEGRGRKNAARSSFPPSRGRIARKMLHEIRRPAPLMGQRVFARPAEE